jgi:hypothetical protein
VAITFAHDNITMNDLTDRNAAALQPCSVIGAIAALEQLTGRPLDGRLSDLVVQRFNMDDDEARIFALSCGDTADAMTGDEPFDRHLRDTIRRLGLTPLFAETGLGRYHQAIRPAGYDYDTDEVIPKDMEAWRAIYRAMPEANQMVAATIVWLYRGGKDTVWLRRVAVAWPAIDAIAAVGRAGVLADWGLLVALYPGW